MSDGSRRSDDNDPNVEYGLEEFEETDGEGGTDDPAGDDGPPEWSGGDPSRATGSETPIEGDGTGTGTLLDPDGMVDDTLTVVVGAVAGVVIGLVTTVALLASTTSAWLGVGLGAAAWLGSTAYLVRRRSVLGAVSHGAYGVGLAFLLVPLVAFSPATDTSGLAGRAAGFLVFLLFMAVPAAVAGVVGYVAGRFDPTGGDREW